MNTPEPVLALDLGGTTLKAAVVLGNATVLAPATRPSVEADGVDAWIEAGLDVAAQAMAESGLRPSALGLSVPGAVDAAAGRLVDLVDRLPSGRGLDLVGAFAGLGLPVRADNDAKAALRAEQRWGGPTRGGDLVVLTLGTGIGSAAWIDGCSPGGDQVLAGNQLGHLTVDLEGDRCVCGNSGCAETVASGAAMLTAARRAGLAVADGAAVFAAEEAGDERAVAVVGRFIAGLTATVVNAVHAYQPSVVVLSGGVMASAERILPPLREAVAERAWTLPRGRVRVEASALGPAAGVLGAAAVAMA